MNNPAAKILIVSPAWIGDMVMTQALLRRLRDQYPEQQLDVLAPAPFTDLVARMPEVTEVIASPFKHGEFNWRARRAFGKSLSQRQYQWAIVTPNSWKSALVPFFANIPKRSGWRGEWRYGLLNDVRTLDEPQFPLMVQRLLALGEPKDAPLLDHKRWWPTLQVSEHAIKQTRQTLNIPATDQPILGLCPGAAFGQSKQWPPEYFADIARAKLAQGWQVWIFGSAADQPAAHLIQAQTQERCVNFAGRTTLGQAIDCLAQCDTVLTNDTGLMHVAAALGKPLVVLYGSSSPKFTPPLSDQAKILQLDLECSPCFERACPLQHFRCMKDLLPELVLPNL